MLPLSFACARRQQLSGSTRVPSATYLDQGHLTEGAATDDLELLKVADFQVQLQQQIQERLDELAKALLLLVPRRGDNPGRTTVQSEESG